MLTRWRYAPPLQRQSNGHAVSLSQLRAAARYAEQYVAGLRARDPLHLAIYAEKGRDAPRSTGGSARQLRHWASRRRCSERGTGLGDRDHEMHQVEHYRRTAVGGTGPAIPARTAMSCATVFVVESGLPANTFGPPVVPSLASTTAPSRGESRWSCY